MNKFQQRLRYIMFVKGIRQRDIVEQTGIEKSKISRYVAGQNMPTGDTLAKIANALGVSAAWLAGEGPDMTQEEIAKMVRDKYAQGTILETERQTIPIVGRVAAGEPILAEENIIGTVLTKDPRPDMFALYVKGDSIPLCSTPKVVVAQRLFCFPTKL